MMLRVRILMIVAGAVVFGYAMRSGSEAARWAGIILVGAALLLRFVGKPRG